MGMSVEGDMIKEGRELVGMSQAALAKLVKISQPALQKIESGETIRSRYIGELLDTLRKVGGDKLRNHAIEAYTTRMTKAAIEPSLGRLELKVYSAAEGGPGEMVISDRPIDIVARPWYVEHVDEAYGVLIIGESMVPAYRPGDYAIVNPRLPPMRNEEMIFTGGEEFGEFRASIKNLLRWSTTEWHVEQYNPPEGQPYEFSMTKFEWPKAVRVVGRYRR